MAYQVGSTCYGAATDAVSAIASAQAGAVVVHGGATYVVNATALTASSITYTLQPLAGGAAITSTVSVTPQPCGLLQWEDGLVLGWGVAAAWIAAAVVMNLRRAAHDT